MKWMRVDDQPPPLGEQIIVYGESCDPSKPLVLAVYFDSLPKAWQDAVTHWMNLPRPPRQPPPPPEPEYR